MINSVRIFCPPSSTQTRTAIRHLMLTAICVVSLAALSNSASAEPVKVAMTTDRWTTTGVTEFAKRDGLDVMDLKPGNREQHIPTATAVLKDIVFRNGIIEFDVLPTGAMGAGVGFRRKDGDNFEDFYLRPHEHCDTADDCIQYAPWTHGVLLWDMFPQYQSSAPLKLDGWNHLKFVVSGRRMDIYVNGSASPTLRIGRLEGDTAEGNIMLNGPGIFANLVVTPDATEGLAPDPEPDATAADRHFVRSWQLSPFTKLAADAQPSLADLPSSTAAWQSLTAERAGLVNISRVYGLPLPRTDRAVAWVKTSIHSEKEQTKTVEFGWLREAWVFVNGKLVYADKNLYLDPKARKEPDGRIALRNGSFQLPLKAGDNEIDIAVANNFYGWGILFHLSDLDGVRLAGE